MASDALVPTSTEDDIWLLAGWLGLPAAYLFMDYVLDRRHSGLTQSESVRSVVGRSPHPKATFLSVYLPAAAWYGWHIVRKL